MDELYLKREQNYKLKKYFTLFLVLAFVTSGMISNISFLYIGDIFLIFAFIISLNLFQTNGIKENKIALAYLYFFIFSFFITILFSSLYQYFSYIEFFKRFIRWSLYTYFLIFTINLVDLEYLKKIMNITMFISVAYLYLQFILYYVFSIRLEFNLFGLHYGIAGEILGLPRFSGFFAEPSHYSFVVSFALLLFVLLTKHKSIRNKYIVCFLVCLSLIITTSTYGIILSAFVLSLAIFLDLKNSNKKYLVYVFVIIFIMAGFLFIFADNPISKYLYSKLISYTSSRRARGISFYKKYMSEFQGLFGIGIGNENIFLYNAFGIKETYFNSISLTFLYGGYLLLFFWIFTIIKIAFNSKKECIFIFVFLLLIIIGSGAFYEINCLFILTIMQKQLNVLKKEGN